MAKYRITYTMVYNGYAEIEAASEHEAEIKAMEIMDFSDMSEFPSCVELTDKDGSYVGCFDYGETTTDYIERV